MFLNIQECHVRFMMDNNTELPGMEVKLGANMSIHCLGTSVLSMKDDVGNESGKTVGE